MVMEDMIYLVHAHALGKYARSTLDMETEMIFIDLEQDPPKVVSHQCISLISLCLLCLILKFIVLMVLLVPRLDDGTK